MPLGARGVGRWGGGVMLLCVCVNCVRVCTCCSIEHEANRVERRARSNIQRFVARKSKVRIASEWGLWFVCRTDSSLIGHRAPADSPSKQPLSHKWPVRKMFAPVKIHPLCSDFRGILCAVTPPAASQSFTSHACEMLR